MAADVCSEVCVISFNFLLPLRDGVAVLVVVSIFIGTDSWPGDTVRFLFMNDADADAEAMGVGVGVAERLVNWATMFAPSLGTHCIERPV